MASLPVGGLYHHFRDILKDLWLLWELMLLAEPIVVIAPDPGVCSEAVVSLVDIINPVSACRFVGMCLVNNTNIDTLLWRL